MKPAKGKRLQAVIPIVATMVVLIISFAARPALVAQTTQRKIQGKVLDRPGNPIPGVEVRAFDDGRQVGQTSKTDATGRYSISFDRRNTVDTLRYDPDLTAWDPGIVELLSGKEDNSIIKVLSRVGESSPEIGLVIRVQETLTALEAIYFIDREAGIQQATLARRYGPTLSGLNAVLSRINNKEALEVLRARFLIVSRLYPR